MILLAILDTGFYMFLQSEWDIGKMDMKLCDLKNKDFLYENMEKLKVLYLNLLV